MSGSPFVDNRFEHEIRHLYYIPDSWYERLEQPKSCLLFGARGTGKSTLLRSLSLRERVGNIGLQQQLKSRRAAPFIGVYVKIPEVHIQGVRSWLGGDLSEVYISLYSRYLELVQLQEIFSSVNDFISLNPKFRKTSILEYEMVAEIIGEFGKSLVPDVELRANRPRSILELSRSTKRCRKAIEYASQTGVSPSDLAEEVGTLGQLGELTLQVVDLIHRLLSSELGDDAPFVKVCFDEAECLDEYGVKILSSWIRNSRSPLCHVISFVSPRDESAQTFLPNLTVQAADAHVVSLDLINDEEFKKFSQGVATLRVREYLAKYSSRIGKEVSEYRFECEKIFGKLNVNLLLESILKRSTSPAARKLLSDAEAEAAEAGLPGADGHKGGDDFMLPIYETYLQERLHTKRVDRTQPKWAKRRAASSQVRKPMVAAYLSICHDTKSEPIYAFADMIFQISDGCIRDFLSNIQNIYENSGMAVEEFFFASRLPASKQNKGLRAASEAKRKSLPTQGLNNPSSISKIITGLGLLTAKLQRESADGRQHLVSTERGLFQLPIRPDSPYNSIALAHILDASEAGFLKITHLVPTMIKFRVHTSLAPFFESSYRGAYYSTPIDAALLNELAQASGETEIRKIVDVAAGSINRPENGRLF